MDLTSYLLGKNASGSGGGSADLSDYFNTEITSNTGGIPITDYIIKKIPTFTIDENVTDLQWCFSQYKYPNLDLSQMNTSNVTNMSYMFYQANTNINFSNFDTSNVTNFTYMFNYVQCKSLDLSSFTLKQDGNITAMFNSAYNLAILDISNFEFSKCGMWGNVFKSCGGSSLQSDGAYADGIPYVYVKNATEQNWILNTSGNGCPSTWSTANVVIKQ